MTAQPTVLGFAVAPEGPLSRARLGLTGASLARIHQ
jgi:hypothetical protein